MPQLLKAIVWLSLATSAFSKVHPGHGHQKHHGHGKHATKHQGHGHHSKGSGSQDATAKNATEPCAAIKPLIADQEIFPPRIPAQAAWDCLMTVPFNQSAALTLVDALVPYVKWQSNTAWLKDPPAEYVQKVQPAIDVFGELKQIRKKVVSGTYKKEYDFGMEIYLLFINTHDGHFTYIPDSVAWAFDWGRPVSIVSVSADGKELPKVYVYSDVLAESLGNSTFTASPISKINGQTANDYLEQWAQIGSLQDRDALYNNIFTELANIALGPRGSGMGTFAGGGRGKFIYPNATTELQFENGTTVSYENYAQVWVDFEGVTDGVSYYQKYLTGPPPAPAPAPPTNSTTASPTPTPTPAPAPTPNPVPAPGYPPPVVGEINNMVGGYYLEDDYSEVAVLTARAFYAVEDKASGKSGSQVFQDVVVKFLAAAKAAGKKKLIIDVSANGGGNILLGYDLFKILFPNKIDHAAADRFRAFESTDLIGQKFSEVSGKLPRTMDDSNATLAELEYDVVSSPFNFRTDTDVNGKNFQSWNGKYGPAGQKGDSFTNLFRWNLSDVVTPLNNDGAYVHGYGPLANYTEQPFAAEDIIVVTDGYCASTCTIFSELMRKRAGVKYVTLGGRPREGITQAIGGTKGTNNYPWDGIEYLAQLVINQLADSPAESAKLKASELGQYNNIPLDRSAYNANVNFRDGIRDGDSSETPLQFVYEPADCRILYTKEMTVDVTAIWKAVADSAWGSKCHCAAGGLGRSKTMKKRELSAHDKALSKRMSVWRRNLREGAYPLDVPTISGLIDGDGYMFI